MSDQTPQGADRSSGMDMAHAALRAARDGARRSSAPRAIRKRRAASEPIGLTDSLGGLVSDRGWTEQVAVHEVLARWAEIVGAEVAEHVQPHAFEKGTLTVTASSSAWATQVRLLAGEFLKRLAAEVGHGVIERIEVRGPSAPSWRKGPRSVPGRGPRDTYG